MCCIKVGGNIDDNDAGNNDDDNDDDSDDGDISGGNDGDIYIMMHVCLFVTKNDHFLYRSVIF